MGKRLFLLVVLANLWRVGVGPASSADIDMDRGICVLVAETERGLA
jgi:hypothetical protein